MGLMIEILAAVLNSLWQAALVAGVVWLALRLLRPINAATRYAIWWGVLAVTLALPAAPRAMMWWQARAQPTLEASPRVTTPRSAAAPAVEEPAAIVTLQEGRAAQWPVWILAIWAALCLYRLFQIGRSYFYLRGVKRRASVSQEALPSIGRSTRLLLSSDIASPMAVGFLHPAVILPESLPGELTKPEMEHVLLHETAHIARKDDWSNLLARLLGAALAPHPVAWWILRQIEREREIACDDWVVARTGRPRPYAQSLARMSELRSNREATPRGEALASGIFGGGSRLGERIEVLLEQGRVFSPRASRARVAVGAVLLLGCVIAGSLAPRWIVFAQARPAFEVASVRLTSPESPLDPPGAGIPVRRLNAGNLAYKNVTLLEYIELAYGIKDYQISKPRPQSLYECYDIVGKADHKVPDEQAKRMLQSLLEDRFKLRLHRESTELPVYALVVGKNGPKFAAGTDDGKSGVTGISAGAIRWHNTSMDSLAEWVSYLPSLGRPVVDRTGLGGRYDFTLTVDGLPDKNAETPARTGLVDALDASIFGALQDLGLKLESDKAPIDIFVIEHVERPDAN